MTLQDRIMAEVRTTIPSTYVSLRLALDEPRDTMDYALRALLADKKLLRVNNEYVIPGVAAAPVQYLDPPMPSVRFKKRLTVCVVCGAKKGLGQFAFQSETCKACAKKAALVATFAPASVTQPEAIDHAAQFLSDRHADHERRAGGGEQRNDRRDEQSGVYVRGSAERGDRVDERDRGGERRRAGMERGGQSLKTVYLVQTRGEFLHPHNVWSAALAGALQFSTKQSASLYAATVTDRGVPYVFTQAIREPPPA